MSNLGATCYLSGVIQALHNTPQLRDFVGRGHNFPFVNSPKAKPLVDWMRKLFLELDQGGARLEPIHTQILLDSLQQVSSEYGNTANDAAEVLNKLLDVLISSSSVTSSEIGPEGPVLSRLLNSWNIKPILPLRQAASACLQAIHQDGNWTELADMLLLQIVGERMCKKCGHIDRTWDHASTVLLQPIESNPETVFTLSGMLEEYFAQDYNENMLERTVNSMKDCEQCKTKSALSRKERRLVKAPPILVLQWNRRMYTMYTTDANRNTVFGQNGGPVQETWPNRVVVPEELDLAPWMKGVTLPSEKTSQGQKGNPMLWSIDEQTQYTLSSVVHYRPTGAHYVSYVRHEDRWVLMDDIRPNPTLCTPEEGIRKHPGEVVYAAIYVKRDSSPETGPPQKQPASPAKRHLRPLTSKSTAELRGIRKGFPLASIVEEDAPSDGPLSIKEKRDGAHDTLSGKKDAREERIALRQRLSIVRAELKEKLELLDSLAKREQELTDFIGKS
ncbi:uncharacterized protein LTHEOB_3514 [Lasiodiplodia theobromae]|uniref:uncharacterized protein n=1 Tax=Lasiodiplodia theobromae TaxID=45133 RepID=UPI0015C3F2C7|nr:uncharacterized protein LTHEOB_3514 [Lasiodiplodia theobromae]KAF4533901.1 hypothetical protein LTHEOB_3514 [Lasiodiplodia theobromae]